MLVELMVRDLGVISEARLVLEPGMTAVTGETGAGKTMLVEAISLLVGQRADPSRVRVGADEARVEGRFEVDGEEAVVARVVPRSGRSRAYVNGRLATAAELAEWGARCIDVHGQHAHQSLLAPAVQRSALDHYGGVDLEPYREALALVSRLTAELDGLGGDERARAREMDMVRFQVAEIDVVEITGPDEDDQLKQREDVLADADGHKIASETAVGALVDEGGVIDGVAAAAAASEDRAPFAAAHARLRSLQAEVDDVARDLRDLAEQAEADPGALAAVQERRRQLAEIRRKYGADLEAVLAFAEEARRRIDDLERHDQRAEEVAAALEAAGARLADAAAAVAAQRREVAPRLARGVQRRLRDLAMPNAVIGVSVEGPDPADTVLFQLAADGGTLQRLTKVASGGELARAMLALRLVLSEAPDTLLFDEVDSGIGGTAATAVGRALADLGTRHQVLVVTHLPQVAACADHHLVVEKLGKAGSVKTSIGAVVDDDRLTELSRMLSGSPDSESARRHAAELLGTDGSARV
jgi:DNA repair protein RecN (Recombination protein N)